MNITLVIGLCFFTSFAFEYLISTNVSSVYIQYVDQWFASVSMPMKLIIIGLTTVYESLEIKSLCGLFTNGKKSPEQFDLSMAFIIFRNILEIQAIKAMVGMLI